MIDGKPSETALMVAAMRASHNAFAPEPKILRDSTALALCGWDAPEAAADYLAKIKAVFTALSNEEVAKQFMHNIECSVCMRSRIVEERMQAMLKSGLEQIVILGAGLDSTAYRFPGAAHGLPIFEVDHPATQKWKREQLRSSGVTIPNQLKFVAYDFENQTLEDALTAGGIRRDATTLFSWLGVHMYLTDEMVKSVFSVLGGFAPGSEIVMDFVMPDYEEGGETIPDSVEELAKIVQSMGEPFRSKYSKEDLRTRLNAAGFGQVVFYNTTMLVNEVMGGNRAAYPMPGETESILMARVG